MTRTTTTITGTIRSIKEGFKFFFVTPTDQSVTNGVDVFVPMTFIKKSGIEGKIGGNMPIVVEAYQQQDGRWAADRIVEIDGRKAVEPTAKWVVPQPTVTTTVVHGKAGVRKHVECLVPGIVARTWWTVDGAHENGSLQEFSSQAAAFEAAGVVLPERRTTGRKTNDPKVSQAMANAPSGGKQKRAA